MAESKFITVQAVDDFIDIGGTRRIKGEVFRAPAPFAWRWVEGGLVTLREPSDAGAPERMTKVGQAMPEEPKTKKEFFPITSTDFVHEMVRRGLVPSGTTRVVIDSGHPEGVVKVYWSGFADSELLSAFVDEVLLPQNEIKGDGNESA